MFKVHFQLKGVDYELVAADLDLTHPYFVSIKEMDLSYEEGMVVNPHLENTKKRFRETSNIMIPFQSVALIETVPPRKQTPRKDTGPRVISLADTETHDHEADGDS